MTLTHSEIIEKLPGAFELALKSGDLHYFPSTVEKLNELDVDFEITLCPALRKKPDVPKPHFDTGSVNVAVADDRIDPLAPPYNKLHVADLKDELAEEDYVILLNKFAVVPHHFLLVTKEFKSQTSPLLPSELVQIYLLLVAAKRAGKQFFAFYNCGDNSGASQPHKHIQFFPTQTSLGPPIEHLARNAKIELPGKPFSITTLPYASHSFRFPSHFDTYPAEALEPQLADAFLQLLDLSISTIRHDDTYPPGRPSYNVLITLEHLHIVPRKFDAYLLGTSGEKLPVNALGFAGFLLVKSEEELQAVKEETVAKILRGVGLESVHDQQIEGTGQELAEIE